MTADGGDDDTLIGGFHAVGAALEHARPVAVVWLADDLRSRRADALAALAERSGVAVQRRARAELDRWLGGVVHQGVAARLAPAEPFDERAVGALLDGIDAPLLLALDEIQDPHNLGACLRTAAAVGASAVVAPRRRAAGLSATVRKVAAGGAERVPFVPVTNLARFLQAQKAGGFWVAGLAATAPTTLYEHDLRGPLIVVAGAEARGLRARTAACCDWLAALPLAPGSDSLNVSVAVGVALFEARRQRGAIAPAPAS